MSKVARLLRRAWYWIGRIPAILLDLPIDWPEARYACRTCFDERWVCENHETRPWPDGCWCGGAGKPCGNCNSVGWPLQRISPDPDPKILSALIERGRVEP